MPRKPKNPPRELLDGRLIHATIKLRDGIYTVQFPDPHRPKKYREISTSERHPADA